MTCRSVPSRRPSLLLRVAIASACAGSFSLAIAAMPPAQAAGKSGQAAGKRDFYVHFGRGGQAAAEHAVRGQGGEITHRFERIGAVAVRLPEAAVQALSSTPAVALIEPVPQHRLLAQTVPWNIDQFQARDLWDVDRDGTVDAGAPDGSGLRICVIDSGIHIGHSDFVGVSIAGETEGNVGTWNSDGSGHGTHVAGTINAMNNNRGVVGVMPGAAELYIVKVFNDSGTWGGGSLAAAAQKCADAGASVISMSLGGGASVAEEAMFQDLYDNFGILNVAAAGNDGVNTHSAPASYESVVSVAAIDKAGIAASFSQTPFSAYDPDSPPADAEWDGVELAGGGVNVLSTVPTPDGEAPIYSVAGAGVTHEGTHVAESGLGSPSGTLVDGGRCRAADPVADWSGDVVLCERGDVAFSEKVNTVRARGGVAAVIYNNIAEDLFATCAGACTAPLIPAIGLSQDQGQALLADALGGSADVVATDGSGCVGCEGGYDFYSGTSMATPGVSAAMGLVWNACGGPTGIDNKQLRQLLRDSALDLQGTQPVNVPGPGDPPEDEGTPIVYGAGYDRVTGWGLVQLRDAWELGNARFGSTCPIGLGVTPAATEVCSADGSIDFVVTLNDQFLGSASLSDGGTAPAGSSGSFNPATVVHPVKDSTYTLSGLENVGSGIYTLVFTATDDADPGNSAEGTANLSVFADIAPAISPLLPAAGAADVALYPTFSWTTSPEASGYQLEVSTSPAFDSLVLDTSVAGSSYSMTSALASATTYYWRVRSSNACGGTDSVVHSFTTANVVCTVVPSLDVPKAIADATGNPNNPTPALTTSALSSSVTGALVDLDVVDLQGTHPWIGDLSFDLVGPAGTSVRLMDQSCAENDNFDLGLDDEAGGSAGGWPCPPVGGGSYRPSSPLSAFDGTAANGTWTLRITDHGKADVGTLTGWGLNLCVVEPLPNRAPTATADAFAVDEDGTLAVAAPGVLGNDTDADGDPLQAELATDVANGILLLAADGGFDYTPDAGFCGTDGFQYRATDGSADSAATAVAIEVACVDDPAIANDDSATVAEDSAANAIAVLANDTDADGDAIEVTSASDAANGSTAFTAGGVSYTPDADFCGADSFTYTVTGGGSATVAMTVTCADDAAVANDDAATVDEDSAANAIAVLANDTDADGDAVAVTGVGVASNGSTAFTAAGVTYTPDADFCGADTFTYTVTDGGSANVAVTVTCVDDAAVANDDATTVAEDSSANAIDVLGNDTDSDGDAIEVIAVGAAANGSTAFTAAGVTYTPDADFCGADSFTYTVSGGDSANVAATVTCADDAAVANDDSATVAEDSAATAIAVLANDTDADGDAIDVTAVGGAGNGSTAFTAASVTYTPNADFCGADTFTYTVSGGDSAAVAVTVTCADDAAVANGDSATVAEDSSANAIDVLGNDTDADGDAIDVTAVGAASNGSTAFTAAGVTYTPDADFCGADAFTYTVTGGDTAAVAVTVTCVDDTAVANDDSATVAEDSGANAIAVLANDSDADGEAVAVTAVGAASDGSTAFTAAGVTYTPDADFCGTDSFAYSIAGGASAVVAVTVTCSNDAPRTLGALADRVASEGDTVSYTTAAAFTDVDAGTVLVYSASGLPASLGIDPATGVIGGTLAAGDADGSPYTVVVSATDDDGASADQAFSLGVVAGGPIGGDIFKDGFE